MANHVSLSTGITGLIFGATSPIEAFPTPAAFHHGAVALPGAGLPVGPLCLAGHRRGGRAGAALGQAVAAARQPAGPAHLEGVQLPHGPLGQHAGRLLAIHHLHLQYIQFWKLVYTRSVLLRVSTVRLTS